MSEFFSSGDSILPVTGVDFSASPGLAVKFTAGVPAVNDSATVPAIAVVLEGNVAAKQSSLGVLGGLPKPVRVRIAADSADMSQGDTIMQKNDGTFTKDVGAGTARCVCGVITEVKGAKAGDLAGAQLIAPQIRA
jgi:hypothetical protein